MKLKNSIKTAFRNLRRRKMRTFLTSFAVSIGAMLIILMVSIGVGTPKIIEDKLKSNIAANVINVNPHNKEADSSILETTKDGEKSSEKSKSKPNILDKNALEKIKAIKEVEDISAYKYIGSIEKKFMDKDIKDTAILAYDLDYPIFTDNVIETVEIKENKKDLKPIIYGRMLKKEDKNSILVGKKLLDKIGIEDAESVIGKEMTLTAKLPNISGMPSIEPLVKNFKIVGVVGADFPNSDQIISSIDNTKDLLGYKSLNKNDYEETGLDKVEVTLKSISDVSAVSDEITKMGYETMSIESMMKGVKSTFTMIKAVLAVIGVINTMTMAIYERTRSIGIMKALGCSRSNIRRLFIMESAAIGFIGGLIGLVFSLINTQIIKVVLDNVLKSKGISDVPNIFSTPIWLILGTIGFAILISVIAGLYPANKASKLDPIESLRYE
ncbi:ABC transporter permease [Clostridium hydrogeniformans]|uniref:ABC transporter permease n=1 Tax=Clostridium hydrogeniformans TaxID=349933 RepID=UPI00048A09E6|nr:FtsX-like permease family protein [Clostridium hydrogeniformans]